MLLALWRTSLRCACWPNFSSSAAEHRLAELLAQGLPLESCAARLNVSINTMRPQLRALFRKTGTTRQAQLINLFTRLIGN